MTDKRKAYWDGSYYDYWLKRTEEHGEGLSSIISGDSKTPNESVYFSLMSSYPFYKKSVLEVGCGFGRLFPFFLDHDLDIYGIDISEKMIFQAKKLWTNEQDVKLLEVSTAEKMPFNDCTIDNVACIATFDATYQNISLSEMIRVCSMGGNIYLSGKNNKYLKNDDKALEAEINARKKQHPNYFTDVKKMISLVHKTGCMRLEKSFFFEKRGDSTLNKYSNKELASYYDYFLIFKKIDHKHIKLENFSDSYSETFKSLGSDELG